MKKNKKVLLTSLTMLFSFALLVGTASCKEPTPEPVVEYTLTLSQDSLNLNLYEEAELEAVAKQDGTVVTDAKIEWTSSAASVASVADGVVESVSVGNAEITATWQGKTATCSVVVADDGSKPVLTVSEAETGLQLLMTDDAYQLNPKVFFKDDKHDTSSAKFTYAIATGGESVATVNAQGQVTPVAKGTTKLTVSAQWKGYTESKEITITVDNEVETTITATQTDISLFNGTIGTQTYSNTSTFTGAVLFNGEAVADTALTWKTSDADVASVNGGVVTALDEGEAEIWFEYNDGETTHVSDKITVHTHPVELTLTDSLGEIVLIDDTTTATADFTLDGTAFATNARTVTKAVTKDGEELRASFDTTNNKLVLANDKVQGTADDYMQGVIGMKNGGIQTLTVYTEEFVRYEVTVNVVSRMIKTVDGLTAFFNDYASDTATLEDVTAYASYGMNVVLNDDVSTATTAGMHYYAGTLDGRGHTITYTGDALTTKQGFLGVALAESGTVKNTAFVGLKSGSQTQAAGLIKAVYGVVDNCYVDVEIGHASRAQGGVCWVLFGTGKVKNTIVKTTVATGIDTVSGKGTICNDNRNGVIENCYSIGVEGKIVNNYVKLNKEDGTDNTNVTFTADGLKALIGTGLPASYNSHWTFTDTELKLGNNTLFTFTASANE